MASFRRLFGILLLGTVPVALSAQAANPKAAVDKQVLSLNRQGMAALKRGDLASARVTFEKVVRLSRRSPEAHNSLGWVLLSQNQPDAAIPHFRRALELRPDFAQAHINLASALAQKGDMEAAFGESREAVRLAPRDPEAHRTLGRVLSFRRDLEGASQELKRAVERSEEHTSELQSQSNLVCRLLLEKKKKSKHC